MLRLLGFGSARAAETTGTAIVPGQLVVAVHGHAAHASCGEYRSERTRSGRWH